MIVGTLAVLLNTLAIAITTFIVSSIAVSVVFFSLENQFTRLEINSRKAILWLLALFPWLAILCVAACFLYQVNQHHLTPFNLYNHWHHIDNFSLISWHSISLFAAAAIFSKVLFAKLKTLFRHHQELNLLKSLSTQIDKNVYQVNLPQPGAFTSGFINKCCYITSGIIEKTSPQEQAVILGHEQAHAELNDPLKNGFLVFSLHF